MKQITWNLGELFSGDNDPAMEERRKAVRESSYAFINKWKDRSDYLEDPVILKEALDEYEAWKRDCGTDGDEGYYFWLRTTHATNAPDLKAKFNKVVLSFFTPAEMLALARQAGFRDVQHVSAAALALRYFAGRADGLRPPNDSEEILGSPTT